jgi:hypothetical protein
MDNFMPLLSVDTKLEITSVAMGATTITIMNHV